MTAFTNITRDMNLHVQDYIGAKCKYKARFRRTGKIKAGEYLTTTTSTTMGYIGSLGLNIVPLNDPTTSIPDSLSEFERLDMILGTSYELDRFTIATSTSARDIQLFNSEPYIANSDDDSIVIHTMMPELHISKLDDGTLAFLTFGARAEELIWELQNERRTNLLKKRYLGELSDQEANELEHLQEETLQYVEELAPIDTTLIDEVERRLGLSE